MIYVDSGFLIALFDSSEPSHDQASRLFDQFNADQRIRLVTTRDVLNEFLAHFSRGAGITRIHAASVVLRIFGSAKYRVASLDRDEYLQALELYRNRPDKRYSMVDCIGMTVMRRQGIQEVVATDRDFEQEGFTNLMISDHRRGVS